MHPVTKEKIILAGLAMFLGGSSLVFVYNYTTIGYFQGLTASVISTTTDPAPVAANTFDPANRNIRGGGAKITSTTTTTNKSGLSTQTVVNPCYVYTPALNTATTYNVYINSNGQTKMLTLPRIQSTPPVFSILDTPYLSARNDSCAPDVFNNGYFSESFVLNTGALLSNGSFQPWGYNADYFYYGILQPGTYLDPYGISGYYYGPGNITSAQRIINEDLLINSVNNVNKTLTTRVSDSNNPSDFAYAVTPDLTNCVKFGGNGPRKIVFMRGDGWNSSIDDFLSRVDNIVENGFKKIDPFMSHPEKLSYYVDLKKFPQASLIKEVDVGGTIEYNVASSNILRSGSSCVTNNNEFEYVFLFSDPSLYAAWSYPPHASFAPSVYLNIAPFYTLEGVKIANPLNTYEKLPWIAIHETGHAVANLRDESYTPNSQGIINTDYTNCTDDPLRDYVASANNKIYGSIIYGSTGIEGCKFNFNDTSGGKKYYRPSQNSIMGTSEESQKFNIISCGYVMAAMDGVFKPLKRSAQLYWPECLRMSERGTVIRDVIPDVNPTPTANRVFSTPGPTALNSKPSIFAQLFGSNKSALLASVGASNNISLMAGESLTVSGSGFTAENNSVQLIKTTDASITYEVLGIPSSDQSNISFNVPTTTPAGNYYLKVGAFNSPWTSVLATLVVSTYVPPIFAITAVSPATPTSVRDFVITGSGFTATGNTVKITPYTLQTTGSSFARAFANASRTITNLTSNGTSIAFTVPANTLDKKYKVAVGTATESLKDTNLTITVYPIGSASPMLTSFNHNSAMVGSQILITGFGFSTSTTTNTDRVRLSSATNGTLEFSTGISGGGLGSVVAPPTQATLIGEYTGFNIPTATIPGLYTVSVSNQYGPWSNGLPFTVLPRVNLDGTFNLSTITAFQRLPSITVSDQRASISPLTITSPATPNTLLSVERLRELINLTTAPSTGINR